MSPNALQAALEAAHAAALEVIARLMVTLLHEKLAPSGRRPHRSRAQPPSMLSCSAWCQTRVILRSDEPADHLEPPLSPAAAGGIRPRRPLHRDRPSRPRARARRP